MTPFGNDSSLSTFFLRPFARLGVISALVGVAPGAHTLAQAPDPDPPNIIFILMDDMGYDAVRGVDPPASTAWPDVWSDQPITTPALSKFANQGVIFTNVRVNPNCSPTRGCLMTGRNAISTGLHGVISWDVGDGKPEVGDALYETSLQSHERTIAEVLQDLGYRTVLFDKWHCGYGPLQMPVDQGFDQFYWYKEYLYAEPDDPNWLLRDQPGVLGDEHTELMKNFAVADWNAHLNEPKAYFFHFIDPHRREADSGQYLWWDLDPELIQHNLLTSESHSALGPDTNLGRHVHRFKQVVDLDDHMIERFLKETGVVTNDDDMSYVPARNTIIFFLADNGTDPLVAHVNTLNDLNDNEAKNSPYEDGIRVPCFVFGAGISDALDPQLGINPALITHVDFFETICDIVGATEEQRRNPNGMTRADEFARDGISFAHRINWATGGEDREYAITSFGFHEGGKDVWKVMMTDGRYKLICRGGGAGMARIEGSVDGSLTYARNFVEEFYDLQMDPEETLNLLSTQAMLGNGTLMTMDEVKRYLEMRDALSDEWPTAVAVAHGPETLPPFSIEIEQGAYLLRVHVFNGEILACPFGDDKSVHQFYVNGVLQEFEPLDPLDPECELANADLQAIYSQMLSQIGTDFELSGGHPDFVVKDVPAREYLTLRKDNQPPGGPAGTIGVGHEAAWTGTEITSTDELRTYIKFDPEVWPIPEGFTMANLTSARVIVNFAFDSPEDDETDSGRVRVHQVTVPWSPGQYVFGDLWVGFNEEPYLGGFDPLPHAVWNANYPAYTDGFDFRSVPLAPGTPVSFGRNTDLVNLVKNWANGTEMDHGIVLTSEVINLLPRLSVHSTSNQQVFFQPQAYLRLTFSR